MCLHEQCAVCAVLRSKGRQTLAHDAIRIGQQLVVEAVQQIIVIRAVKAQLSARVHADIVLLRFALEAVVAQQERLRLAARRGQVDVGVVEALAVVVVGNADGIIAARGVVFHNGLSAQPAAVGDIGGVQMGFDAVHKLLLFVYENAAGFCGILDQQRCG